MVSYSVKLKCNKARIQTDGFASLYLQVIINRSVYAHPLNLRWPPDFVDNKLGVMHPRSRRDSDFSDYALIIDNELKKINEVFKLYRIQDRLLTMDLFHKELRNIDRRRIFTSYMSEKIEDRFKTNDITKRTRTNSNGTVNKLLAFKKIIHFHEIDSNFLRRFATFLRKQKGEKKGNEDGTVWTRIKDIKAYLDLARIEGIPLNQDYEKYINKEPKPAVTYHEDDEIESLVRLYNSEKLDQIRQQTLRAYLFSCFTSLRISDVQRVEWSWLKLNNELEFIPWKTRRFKKLVNIPLSKIARSLIERRIGKFFNLPSDQEINRSLKVIAGFANIKTHMTFHVARHTFGTHYYRQTKDIVSLQKIMGHSKISTTMIYVHVNESDKRTGMEKMDDAFLKTSVVVRMVG